MKRFAITPLAALGILAGTVPAARAADATCTTTISSGTTINGNLTVPAGATCTLANVTVTGNVQVGKGASLTVQPGPGQTVTIGGNVQAAQCQSVLMSGAAMILRGKQPSRSAEISPAITIPGGALLLSARSAAMCRSTTIPMVTERAPPWAEITSAAMCRSTTIPVCQSVALVPFPGGPISVGGNVQIRNCTDLSGYRAESGTVTIDGNFACDNNSAECNVAFGSVRGNVQVNNNSGSSASVVGANAIVGNLQCAGNTPGVTDAGLPNTVTGTKQGQCAGANF